MNLRYKEPDKKNALSIVEAAKRDMGFTLTLEITDESSSTLARNIYEAFRMLGDALLVSRGTIAEGHVAQISELLKIKVDTKRPVRLIDNLRRLRHNINYYGYQPKKEEVEDAINFAKCCFKPLVSEVIKEINK